MYSSNTMLLSQGYVLFLLNISRKIWERVSRRKITGPLHNGTADNGEIYSTPSQWNRIIAIVPVQRSHSNSGIMQCSQEIYLPQQQLMIQKVLKFNIRTIFFFSLFPAFIFFFYFICFSCELKWFSSFHLIQIRVLMVIGEVTKGRERLPCVTTKQH